MLLICLYIVTVYPVISQAHQLMDHISTTVRMLNTLRGTVARFCMCAFLYVVCVMCVT